MKKLYKAALFLSTFSPLLSHAQDFTIRPSEEMMLPDKKLLLVPFDPTFYMSDFDKEVSETSKMSYNEMREKYRNDLDFALGVLLKEKYASESMLRNTSEETIKDLNTILHGIKYEWVPVDHKDKKPGKNESTSHASKQQITRGEVVVKPDNTTKYMRVKVTNPELLKELSQKYNSQYFVFVNQFELKNAYKDQLEIMRDTYKREVRVHYSVLDVSGKEINGGIGVVTFDNHMNDINEIIKTTFPKVSEQVLASVPGIGKAPEEKVKKIPKF
jgi:hypothetical protein